MQWDRDVEDILYFLTFSQRSQTNAVVWEFVSADGSSIKWSGGKERSGRNLEREREKRKYDVS